ncbi:MAG: phosphoglycerate mutase [Micavibrio sp.]|nr:phosphoglycerate mutase [Micavibrio sp.]
MAFTRFFLFRHDTPDNPDDICYGADMRVKFSPKKDYVAQLAQLPADVQWMASPLPRTMDTAFMLTRISLGKNPRSVGIIRRPDLREQFFGTWVGTKRRELAKDATFHAYKADPVNVPPPGGENLKDFALRVRGDFNRLAGLYSGKNVAVVTHAGVIRAQAAAAKDIDMLEALTLPVAPLSLTILTHDSEKKAQGKNPWALDAINLKP